MAVAELVGLSSGGEMVAYWITFDNLPTGKMRTGNFVLLAVELEKIL